MAEELKDPFARPPEPPPPPPGDPVPPESLGKGKVRRNLHIVALMFAAVAIVLWMFWPQAKTLPASPDQSKASQAAETNGAGKQLLQQLQADASAASAQPASAPAAPVAGTGTYEYRQAAVPTPMGDGGAAGRAVYASADTSQPVGSGTTKEEDAWASALDVGSVTLKAGSSAGQRTDSAAAPVGAISGIDPANQGSSEAGGAPGASPASLAERQLDVMGQVMQRQQTSSAKASDAEFVKQASAAVTNPVNRQQPAYTEFALYQGTVVRSVLLTGMNSDLPCTVTARVTSTVYDSVSQRMPLVPAGSRLYGVCKSEVSSGQTRILVALQRLIRPDGTWIALSGATGADMQGMGGVAADVDTHFLKIFGSSLVIGAASLLASTSSQNVTVNVGAGATQLGGSVFAQTLSDTVRAILQRNVNIQPTLTVEPGSEFLFVVSRDMLLSPWRTK